MGVLLAFVGALAFSFMNVFVRRAAKPGDADSGVLTTMLINLAAYVLLLGGVWLAGGVRPLNAGGVAWFVAAGFSATFLGRQTLFGGIRLLGAARAAAIKNATPLVTLAIALLILGERLSPLAGAGVLLVLAGLAALVLESLQHATRPPVDGRDDPLADALSGEALAEAGLRERTRLLADRTVAMLSEPSRRALLFGVVLSAIAALAFGTGHAFRKLGMDLLPDAILGATIGTTTALLAFLLAAAVRGQAADALRSAVRAHRPYIWAAGVAGTIGQLSFFIALAFAPVSHVSVVAGSETVLTVILAALIARRVEVITRRVVIPAGFVFAGTALIAVGR